MDTYGGAAPHGGGAFSGKDPTKVDRSAAYAARWVAKTVVAAGLAKAVPDPAGLRHRRGPAVSILVETFGTGTVADEVLEQAVRKTFDLRPTAIIRDLDLRSPSTRSWPPTATWAEGPGRALGDHRPGRPAEGRLPVSPARQARRQRGECL